MSTAFSVLVAAFNAEQTIGETLDSLTAQTHPGWEAIVVDDGSADATLAVAKAYAARDPRIIALTKTNGGTASARNLAASRAAGPWLLALDADDMLESDALERQAGFMSDNPGFDIYSWGLVLQGPDGTRGIWPVSARHPDVASYTLEQLIEANIIPAGSVVGSGTFHRLGGYRDVFLEDYDFWLRALAQGARHIHNPQPLSIYRVSASSKNADPDRRMRSAEEVLIDLAAQPGITRRQRRLARRAAAFQRGMRARLRLEARMDAGDFHGALGDYIAARPAYAGLHKWLAGLALVAICPRLFARIAPRSDVDGANIETPVGMLQD